jgi:hypothetical protein
MSSFWVTHSVAELARTQGVAPLTRETLKKADFWLDDLDPEVLIRRVPSPSGWLARTPRFRS